MKTRKSGSYYFLLLTVLFSMASCSYKPKAVKDSQPLQFNKLDKNVAPVEVLRFFSSTVKKDIADLNIYQPQL